MKKISSKTKVLVTLLVTLLVIGALAVASFAADKEASYEKKYGQIVPTDSKLEARKTSFSFYGDKATLYFMRISEGKSNANWAVEIYSDKACTKLIRSMSEEFGSKGNRPMQISWSFKTTPSGTYYGKCYAYISRDDGNVIDTDTVQKFKIKIDRLSKKTVELNSVKSTSDGVKFTWTPLATATKYRVYRKGPGDKSWKYLTSLGKGDYTYTDKSAKSGKTYKYTVRAYDGDYKSRYNKKGLSLTYVDTPELVGVSGATSSGYAKFTWKAVPGAKGYEIYRKGGTLNSYEWKKIATVKGGKTVSYVDKKAKRNDWCYSYTVRAVNGSYKSTYNTEGVEFNYILAPKLNKAFSYKDGVKITWKDSSDVVTKYYVYRKTSSGWKKIGATTKKYFTDTKAVSGKTYTYTVKGVASTNSGAYNSKGIKESYLSMPKLSRVIFDENNYAKVTWATVDGASSYKILRKINSAKEWTEIATVKGGTRKSYLDKTAKKSGYTYKYTVRAFDDDAKSYYNKTGIKNMYLAKPSVKITNKVTSDNAVGISLKWKAINGAEGYQILRQTAGKSKWTTLAENVTKTSFYDATVKNGVKYRYAVKAVNGSSISKYTSVYMVALNRPVMESVKITDKGVALSWTAVEGADTYYVYRKAAGEDWSVIGSYSLNSFVDTSKEAKTTPFSYTVVAEAKGYKSDYDTAGMKNFVEATKLTAEFTPAAETEKPYVLVKWTLDKDVESYKLYKTVDGESTCIGTYDSTSDITEYKDENITLGKEYKYTIKAIKDGKLSTKKSITVECPYPPVEAVEFDVVAKYSDEGSYIKVKFTPVEFAEKYEIYRKTSAKGEWSKIKTIKASAITEETYSYVDKDVDTGIKYYYTVKGVASDRDSLYNEKGKKVVIYTPLEPATGIVVKKSVDDEKTVAIIVWDSVENAESYKVLRKVGDGEWEALGQVESGKDLRFVDDTIEQGVEYTYTIKATSASRGDSINKTGADFCWKAD